MWIREVGLSRVGAGGICHSPRNRLRENNHEGAIKDAEGSSRSAMEQGSGEIERKIEKGKVRMGPDFHLRLHRRLLSCRGKEGDINEKIPFPFGLDSMGTSGRLVERDRWVRRLSLMRFVSERVCDGNTYEEEKSRKRKGNPST